MCVIQIPINYESTANQTNRKVKDLLENKTARNNKKKKKKFVCDLLFLAKRHEYRLRISQWVHTVLYYYSCIHTI